MTTYFGQHGEDCLLLEFFKNEPIGFYADIGAFDGKHLSNTYLFDKLGWNGVCVEADKRYFDLCKKVRSGACIHAACVGDPNITEISFMALDQPEIGSRLQSCLHNIRPGNKKRFTFTKTTVPAMTLTRVLEQTAGDHKIDLLSIDVEGEELNILRNFDFDKYRPRVLVAEANTTQEKDDLNSLLASKGLLYAGSILCNHFYATTQADVKRLRQIDTKCHIKTQHPMDKNSRSNKDGVTTVKLA